MRGDGMWHLAPKCQRLKSLRAKLLFALFAEPRRHAMRKEVVWSSAALLEAASPWMNYSRMSERIACVR